MNPPSFEWMFDVTEHKSGSAEGLLLAHERYRKTFHSFRGHSPHFSKSDEGDLISVVWKLLSKRGPSQFSFKKFTEHDKRIAAAENRIEALEKALFTLQT